MIVASRAKAGSSRTAPGACFGDCSHDRHLIRPGCLAAGADPTLGLDGNIDVSVREAADIPHAEAAAAASVAPPALVAAGGTAAINLGQGAPIMRNGVAKAAPGAADFPFG